MVEDSTVFVGIDAAKLKNAVAVAEFGGSGEVRYIGEVDASSEAMRRRLACRWQRWRPGTASTAVRCFSGDDRPGTACWWPSRRSSCRCRLCRSYG